MEYKNLIKVPNEPDNNVAIKDNKLMPLIYAKINEDDNRYQYIISARTREEIFSIRTQGDFIGHAIFLNPSYHYEIGCDHLGQLILVPLRFK